MSWNARMGSAIIAAMLVASTAACGADGDEEGAGGSGCSFGPTDKAAWTTTLDEAASEGALDWYHVFSTEQAERVIGAFNDVCPAVSVTQTATGKALLPLVEQQLASGKDGADMFTWADEEWFKANADEMAELSGPFSSDFPTDAYYVPGKVPRVFINTTGFLAWNTTEFPDGFDDFEDLTDPALKGRIGMRGDVTTAFIGFLNHMEESYGPDYLPALAKNDPKFYPSAYVTPQAVASGEIGVTNTATFASMKALKDVGAPIDFAIPENSYSSTFSMGVLESAKHKAAAQVMAEFLLSPEGQQAVVGDGEGGSALDVEGSLKYDSTAYVLAAATVTDELRTTWTAKFEDIFR